MTHSRSTTLWTVHFVVYVAGLAVLMNQSRTVGTGSAALWLPFAFPPLLVWIAALADRAEAQEPSPSSTAQVSVVTGEPTIRRSPTRTIRIASFAMLMTPFTRWVLPEDASPAVRLAFLVVILLCAGVTGYVIPRLQPRIK